MKTLIIMTLGLILNYTAMAENQGHNTHENQNHSTHWEYTGNGGPEHWSKLKNEYALCAQGKNQSPINISDSYATHLRNIQFNYRPSPLKIINNGHTIQLNFTPGSSIKVDNHVYQLLQMHFHSPSEHHIQAYPFPMEAHLVHKDNAGNLAVIGIMLKEGAPNPFIDAAWKHLPQQINHEKLIPQTQLNALDMLPFNQRYYRYNGSLTTPPCSEGVRWMVMRTPLSVSRNQIQQFSSNISKNARPLQSINSRMVLK